MKKSKYIEPMVKARLVESEAALLAGTITDTESNLPPEDNPNPGGGGHGPAHARSYNVWDDGGMTNGVYSVWND
jgi:hypothetical protein